jgi:hypothetical protein
MASRSFLDIPQITEEYNEIMGVENNEESNNN